MSVNILVFLLGLLVSSSILFGLFLFYAHAFAEEVAHEGRTLPSGVQGLVSALDQDSGSPSTKPEPPSPD
jgi:hypothetical protein